jgi:hypothetical protein
MIVRWAFRNEEKKKRSQSTVNDKRNQTCFSLSEHIKHESNEDECGIVKHLSEHVESRTLVWSQEL